MADDGKRSVCVGLDLGSDTLKIAYSYNRTKPVTGKIVGDTLSMTAVPAVAYYDFDEEKWIYGEAVDTVGDKSFTGVVKIKFLLSLLLRRENADVTARNRDYYFNKNDFPKFYFPVRRKIPADFEKAVNANTTFNARGFTPADVCAGFFRYVNGLVHARLGELFGDDDFTVRPSAVYPQRSCKEYIDELERLVCGAFETDSIKSLSMTKSLCAYATFTRRIRRGESVLIFNLGEEKISVVKAGLLSGGVAVDGTDGHNDPENLGGNDIDDAVAAFFEGRLSGRESMGRPSCGEDGYHAEESLNSKQYLFVKDIKTAKVILGIPAYEKSVFKNGVPVCVSRDLYIQQYITRQQFLNCVGIADGTGVAQRILEYIKTEAERPVNSDVKKIFLTGGPVETYGLVEFISKNLPKYNVLTFEKDDESYDTVENDGFNILAYEDALYAPALGCALSDLKDIDIKTVLALSYGLRLFLYEGDVPYLELLVNKGDVLPPDGAKFFTPRPEDRIGLTTSRDSINSAPMHIMSTIFTREDIQQRRAISRVEYVTTASGKNYLKADPFNRRIMEKLVKYAGVKILSGGADKSSGAGVIYYYYNKTRVRLIDKVYAVIGVDIDGEGRARPYAENDRKRNGDDKVTIIYLWDIKKNGKLIYRAGERQVVYKKDIRFDFDIGEMIFS